MSPPKCLGSVSTLNAAAPPASYAIAAATGSSGAICPCDGLARFTSAMTARPVAPGPAGTTVRRAASNAPWGGAMGDDSSLAEGADRSRDGIAAAAVVPRSPMDSPAA